MSVRSIIFTAMTLAVVGALVLLFAKAGETPESDVSEQALERARQRHARAQSKQLATAREAPGTAPQTRAMQQWKRPDRESDKDKASRPIRTPDTSSLTKARATPGHAGNNERATLRVPSTARTRPSDAERAELQRRIREVNRTYDRRDFEGALAAAKEILADKPSNVRLLRVVVSSACAMGNEAEARAAHAKLPPRHQRQMTRRCSRYGMELGESAE